MCGLAALGCALGWLAMDQAGRAGYELRPPGGAPFGGDVVLRGAVPPGRYELFVEARFKGELPPVIVAAKGRRWWCPRRRSSSLWPVNRISNGVVDSDGRMVVEIESAPGDGGILGVRLERTLPLGLGRDAIQRLLGAGAAALAALAIGLRGRLAPLRLPALLIALPWLRQPLFGLQPLRHGDMRTAFYPWHVLTAAALDGGRLPLWNPGTFLGLPHVANMQTQVLFPPVLASLLAGWSFAARETLVQLSALAAAAMGAALLARRLGARAPGATIAGLLFMASSPISTPEHAPMLCTMALLPWVVLAVLRRRGATLLAAVLATAFLAGHLQLFSYALLAAAVAWAAGSPVRLRLRSLAGGLALGGLLASILALPLLENGLQSVRSRGLAPSHAAVGALHADMLARLLRTEDGDRTPALLGISRSTSAVATGVAGLPLAAFALADLSRRRRRRPVLLMLALAGAGIAVALGRFAAWSPFGLLGHVPLFAGQRGAARAFVLAALAFCLLAGRGLDRLLATTVRPRALALPALAGALVLGSAVALARAADVLDRAALAGACAQGLLLVAIAVAVWLGERRARLLAAVIVALVAADRFDDASGARPADFAATYAVHPFARRAAAPGLRELCLAPGLANDALLAGRATPWGYDPVVPRRTALWWNALDPRMFQFDDAGRLVSLGALLRPEVLATPAGLDAMARIGVQVLRLPPETASALGRAVARRAQVSRRWGWGIGLSLARARRAYLDDGNGGGIAVRDVSPQEVAVSLAGGIAAGRKLVLADAYFPGWEARADGRPVAIEPYDIALRAVPLPAGTRQVVFRYRPFSFRLGLFLTGLGIMLLPSVRAASSGNSGDQQSMATPARRQ